VNDKEVIAAEPSGKKILNSLVSVFGFGGYADLADQFGHLYFEGASQLMV